MNKIAFTIVFVVLVITSKANHISGGEMIYDYLGPGAAANTIKYRITLRLFRDNNGGGAAMPASVYIGIFDTQTGIQYPGSNQPYDVPKTSENIVPVSSNPCMSNPPILNYSVGYYELTVDLPINLNGYTCSYQTCCRICPLINVFTQCAPAQGEGSTYVCKIPGTVQLPTGHNSSPRCVIELAPVCGGNPFSLSFHATDPDGDSLSYYFCPAYNRGASINSANVNPTPPPYVTVTYINGYAGTLPLGNTANVNQSTGIVSGIAPAYIGSTGAGDRYVVCVCIDEFRNGQLIGTHRKDFILTVSNCDIPDAQLDPQGITCDGFTVSFQNNGSNANVTTWFWDFGDPTTGANNTSNLSNPTHTFSDTGVFIVKLVVNRGQPCADSTTQAFKVYPGFFPGFINSAPMCINVPIQFTDTTYNRWGINQNWRWDFGDPSTLADTSHLQNPVYTYTAPGTYAVTLHVESNLGCSKDTIKNITILATPPLSVFPGDTTYCGLDTLQLTASGTGNFTWTPNINIIGANTPTPLVYPATATRYVVTLNNSGCIGRDSVLVTPKLDLSNSITASSTNICEEDTITLTGNSNYTSNVNWQWSPIATLESPTNKVTRAYPLVATTYSLVTTWGQHCVANASIPITVKPLAVPNAGPDTAICNGQGSVQLNASGGVTYQWTPVTGLSNPTIPNPIASPSVTTTYKVSVGVIGCSKKRDDSVIVAVRTLPALGLDPSDTLICSIDTLQLNANGSGNFIWTPNYMISNTNIPNPLVSPDVPTKYYLRLTDAFGCFSLDSIFINVKTVVTIDAGNDTSLCKTDGFLLTTTSDALRYKWTPSTYLNYDTLKNPFATPLSTITYHVVGNIGKCQSEDSVTIKVVPYPPADAGSDLAVCPGFNAQLFATGGSNYVWSPATFLNNRFIQNPIAINPTASIRYIVTVTDTLGCPKPTKDTVLVRVYAKAVPDAGPRDTSVVEGQPLTLTVTGMPSGSSYLWSPVQWLSNFTGITTVATPLNTIEYVVEATSPQGCKGNDSVLVRVFKLDPDMYVPTAFTPNGDGLNDILRPILIGMKELRYFRVYNRFGQMLYATSDIGKGWDGKFGGRGQDPGTYVWMAEGITYKNQTRFKKGYAVLIRQ